MKILVVGNEAQHQEMQEKFPNQELFHYQSSHDFGRSFLKGFSAVIDFTVQRNPEILEEYRGAEHLVIFAHCVNTSLAEIYYMQGDFDFTLVGFNGMHTCINRPLWELSALHEEDKAKAKIVLDELQIGHEWVADRVGMASPRVICMIINEAYFTVQEGTASREDIDLGMKLGTNYPLGPFEWCNKIGLTAVYELLEALYEDTKDERYKICPLLKREYLLQAE